MSGKYDFMKELLPDNSVEAKKERYEEGNKKGENDPVIKNIFSKTDITDQQELSFEYPYKTISTGGIKRRPNSFDESLRGAIFTSEYDCKYTSKSGGLNIPKTTEEFIGFYGRKIGEIASRSLLKCEISLHPEDSSCLHISGEREHLLNLTHRQKGEDLICSSTYQDYFGVETISLHPKHERPIQGPIDKTMSGFLKTYASKLSNDDLYIALKDCTATLNEDGALDIECPNDIVQSTIADYVDHIDRHYIAKYFGENAWDFGLLLKEGDDEYKFTYLAENQKIINEILNSRIEKIREDIKERDLEYEDIEENGFKIDGAGDLRIDGDPEITSDFLWIDEPRVKKLKKFLNDNIKD